MGLSFLSGGRRSVVAVAMCLLSVPLPAANRQLERDVLGLPGAADYVFHIGRNACSGLTAADFASLHPYGYYVVKRGRDVYLAGRTENGTDYALADFLRRYAGYRDFGSPFGTVRPHVDRLVLPEGDFVRREEPEIASYNLAGDGSSRFFGRDKRTTCSATHAMRQMVPSELFATHPEYFSMRDGKRFDPKDNSHGWQPCMCNPDLPKLFAAYAERYFKERPDAIGIPMGVNDGSGDCKCPGCEALYAKYGNPYVEFYNMAARSLAKSHPGKFLAFIAYAQRCSHAPRNFRMEPNVLVEVTGMRDVFGLLREWKAAGGRHFGIYEYLYGFSGSRIASGHYPHVIADFFRRARREFGMETLWEEYFCPMPLFDGGRQYVVSELMWNMDADVDALLDDYFSSLYGPAAAPMKCYHAIAERAFVARQKVGGWKTFFADYYNPQQFDGYTPKALAAMKAALAEAASLVREGTDEARRVRTFRRVSEFPHALAEARLCAREMDRAAEASGLGANGLVFNPSLAGGSSLDPSRRLRGGFANLELRHVRGDLVRAVMEGVAFGLKVAKDELSRQVPLADPLVLTGGGAKAALWRRIYADVFGCPVVASVIGQQCAALGAAALAAVGTGVWPDFSRIAEIAATGGVRVDPVADNVAAYRMLEPRHRALTAMLSDWCDRFS